MDVFVRINGVCFFFFYGVWCHLFLQACHFPSILLLPIFTSASCFNQHHSALFFFFPYTVPELPTAASAPVHLPRFPRAINISPLSEKTSRLRESVSFFQWSRLRVWTVNFRHCAKTWAAEFRLLGIFHFQHATGLVSREKWIIKGKKEDSKHQKKIHFYPHLAWVKTEVDF